MAYGPKLSAFLSAIRVMPNVTRAAAAAGINKSQHYAKLQSSPQYRVDFQEALQIGCDGMSDIAVERASIGWEEPIVYQGAFSYPLVWDDERKRLVPDYTQPPLTIRKIDNNLLQFVLKNRHPDYREREQKNDETAAPPPLIIQTWNDSPLETPIPHLSEPGPLPGGGGGA